jgi:hypothetical protein
MLFCVGSEFVCARVKEGCKPSRRVVNHQVFKLQDIIDAILAGKYDCHMGGMTIAKIEMRHSTRWWQVFGGLVL